MKSRTDKLLCFVLVTATALLAGACAGNSPTRSTSPVALSALPHSMKGYELYSWPAAGGWNFALLTGTDRLKSADEITTGPDTVNSWVKLSAQSVDALKVQLGRLPQNESISWIGKQTREQFRVEAGPLELPPQAIVDARRLPSGRAASTGSNPLWRQRREESRTTSSNRTGSLRSRVSRISRL